MGLTYLDSQEARLACTLGEGSGINLHRLSGGSFGLYSRGRE